ncbi:MAG: hypothetical protein MJ134_03675 [Lachnospiraceae bacterium]|nr:hypothetical protein [Lachnospiraceae bacterium]
MKRFKSARGAFFLMLLVIIVLIAYYTLSLKTKKQSENIVTMTPVQTVLNRDLNKDYPPTPKEVVKYYSEITKCFYNETYTDEELEQLAMQAKAMYDDKLAANKSDEDYINDLKAEIAGFREQNYTISSYATSASTDVERFSQDGYNFARLYCTYFIRIGTVMQSIEEVYLLRLDEKEHWRIFGWDLASAVEDRD